MQIGVFFRVTQSSCRVYFRPFSRTRLKIIFERRVDAGRKFQPSFSHQPFVRLVAATNTLPYRKDTKTGAGRLVPAKATWQPYLKQQ